MTDPIRTRRRTALWVIPVADLGGVARHVIDVTTAGIPGWHVIVLAPPGDLIDRLRALGVAAIEGRIGPEHGTATSVQTLRTVTGRLRPDIVHSHLAHADVVNALASVGPRGPARLSTEHGISGLESLYQSSDAHARAMLLAHRARLRRFDSVIAVSESTAEQITERWLPPRRLPIHTIANGIDPSPERRTETRDRSGLRLVSISRLSAEKRVDRAITAFAELHRHHPDARFTIAGTGPDHDALAALITGLGLEGAAELIGFGDPADLLPESDVLIQLSAWENCSYTLLDALRADVGVVATPVGGNPELLPDRCLVDADDTSGIVERILEQATLPGSRPGLPPGWPTVAEMNRRIASVYDGLRP